MSDEKFFLTILISTFIAIFIICGSGMVASSYEAKRKVELEAIKAGLHQEVVNGKEVWVK